MAKTKELKTYNDINNEFHRIYHSKIKSIMVEFEKKRRIELLKFILILFVSCAIIYLCLKYCFSHNDFNELLMLFVMGIPIIAAFQLYNIEKNFSKSLKEACLPKIVKAFGNMKWFNGKQKLLTDDIYKSELFSEFNKREDDDAFVGEYKEVDFTISETALWFDSGGSKGRIIYRLFKGVIITFSSNKKIKNKTMIATKNDIHIKGRSWGLLIAILMTLPMLLLCIFGECSFRDSWYLWLLLACSLILFFSKKGKEKLDEIKLEDVEFNKHYKAFSSDEVEGRYLITTAFMERFKNLQTAFGASKAKCSFYDNDIMFAISTKRNLFEIGNLFTSLTNPKHMTRFFNELSSILLLIDYFKLDEKTGL